MNVVILCHYICFSLITVEVPGVVLEFAVGEAQDKCNFNSCQLSVSGGILTRSVVILGSPLLIFQAFIYLFFVNVERKERNLVAIYRMCGYMVIEVMLWTLIHALGSELIFFGLEC